MSGMFGAIASIENLLTSWREFRRGKRATSEVQIFERHLEDHVFRLHQELVSGMYHHGPYTRFVIQDPKQRVIHKARVRDRLMHHAVARVLQPIFERSFIHDSYSCRKGKGPHAAVRRLEVFSWRVSRNFSRPCWALKFDIRKFFDSVDHDILLYLLAEKISCSSTRQLLAEIVRSYHVAAALGGG
ncbi:MAG: RNA-directed DNA polymerase [Parcubacteria group bacterium Gr01-1014_106]|nr:MAG: RNA-directed DNA polymerase [Parcubacteria group bacterium Gr01-1014_106]